MYIIVKEEGRTTTYAVKRKNTAPITFSKKRRNAYEYTTKKIADKIAVGLSKTYPSAVFKVINT